VAASVPARFVVRTASLHPRLTDDDTIAHRDDRRYLDRPLAVEVNGWASARMGRARTLL
jgi:hypothetical protein